MQGSSPSSPAGPRLWRPAAQRNVRNSWSSIAKHLVAWTGVSSNGPKATSLVNALLSERYVESMDFGILKAMEGIQAKAHKKFFAQGEFACKELVKSYKDLVESLLSMLKAKGSMRTYLKESTTNNVVEFSDQQHLSEDKGDGDGFAVFSTLSLSTHEALAQELINMFLMEIKVKLLIVTELLFIFYSSVEDDYAKKQTLEGLMRSIYDVTSSKLPEICAEERKVHAMGTVAKVKRDVLQVYMTAWLAEVNIRKSRIIHSSAGKMRY